MTISGFDLLRAAMSVTDTDAPQQSVLNVLAIMANDDAQCWPAINGPAGLTGKTKLSERTVQRAVQGLKTLGHINWVDKPGRGRVYIVHPRHSDTPVEETPVTATPRQNDGCQSDTPVTVTPTPVTVTPHPRHSDTQTAIELPFNSQDKPEPASDADAPSLRPEHVVEAWNDMADRKGLAKVRALTPERRRKLNNRIRSHPVEHWTEAIDAIERSPFLLGENDRGWRADFDFLLQPSSFTKLIEGVYDRQSRTH
ncbi:hypothetical protein [Sphingomonas sp. Leaf10]|uniref:hypothetical protein n=1 Tax=Sphingomonas sp. Leaf10 TaxID=1735676 RepID=UPI0006FB4DD8|nr:hypothetical protein [Sphingomonas sp. Leaf10]KQM37958.1 hypothetical protein ASE59_11710 [Sphingomonas sp. Leaf10]